MADDRMKHDDQQRNMGAGDRDDQDFGQQSPGRSGQAQGGYGGGQQAGKQGQQGGQFGQPGSQNMEDDDEFATGGQGEAGGQNRGGQNRGGQNR